MKKQLCINNSYYSQTWSAPTHFKHTENSLEHCIIFTHIINSETVETESAVCIIHHKKYFKLLTCFTTPT
jgi:hypothetical protein